MLHHNTTDITGQRYGRLVVQGPVAAIKRKYHWHCICDCGTSCEVSMYNLKNGNTKSCGCLHKQIVSATIAKTNLTHSHSFSKTYESWIGMKSRCNNPNASNYHNYGGRGIAVCDSWSDFENFLADMGERPEGTSIGRINVNGNYEPTNCRWETAKEQGCAMRTNILMSFDGRTQTVQQWADELGWPKGTLHKRLQLGWSHEKILTTPRRRTRAT